MFLDEIEIKPAFRMREQEVQIKVEVAKKYCENNNLDFDYIDEHYLKANSPSLEEIKLLSNVEIKKPSN